MEIEKQVASLELSKKLKQLGVKQESYFYWKQRKPFNDYILSTDVYKEHEYYSAFTVAELGEILPRVIQDKWFLRTKPVKNDKTTWSVQYVGKRGKEMTFRYSRMAEPIQGNTEADARAKMLTYLIEHELMSSHTKHQIVRG